MINHEFNDNFMEIHQISHKIVDFMRYLVKIGISFHDERSTRNPSNLLDFEQI